MSANSNPPQDVIELTFGPLIAGTWIQQLLLGFILAQMVDYYRMQFDDDSKFNRVIVSLLLFFNVLLGGTDLYVQSSFSFFPLFETNFCVQPRSLPRLGAALWRIRVFRSARMDNVAGARLHCYRRLYCAGLLPHEVRPSVMKARRFRSADC